MEQFMVWYVLDSIISPDSDTAFSLISSTYNLKFVLWYDTDHYLAPGDRLETSDDGLIVNGHVQNLYILDVSTFRSDYWRKLHLYNKRCPGNTTSASLICDYKQRCRVKKCPFIPH
ncbi:hypothetical protein FKM52_01220 [Mixta tenebrionis]|uniref:Anti-adapter protein IraM n=1 Tax=Mixta tenebrionis TaxID=2562439 RepID=A0A506VE91_9GAMM|nr:hypothetical protein FKM52_01220 [Mixta tenebrionis]